MAEKAARTQSKGAFTRSVNALRDAISTEAPTVSIDRKLQRMQECYQEVEKCHQAYQISLTDPDEDADAWITEVSTAFESAEVEADRLRERRLELVKKQEIDERKAEEKKAEEKREEEKKAKEQRRERKEMGIKIEKLKIEQFDGELRAYPQFKRNFEKFIVPNLQHGEVAFVLKNYLSKDVRRDVDMLDDQEEVWKRLDNKYGNRRKLVDSILTDIKQLKMCNDDQPLKTLAMIEVIEKAYRDLEMLGMTREINNSTIISSIESKLPSEIEKEWIKLATYLDENNPEEDRFPELLKLLVEFKRRLEYKHSELRSAAKESRGRTYLAKDAYDDEVMNRVPVQRNRCWIHPQEDHPIWKCEEFRSKEPKERSDIVKENNACFKCLEKGHIARWCRRNFACNHDGCGGPHHNLLHGGYQAGSSLHTRNKDDTLLQLQLMAAINAEGKSETVNVLWDAGSTLSFVTFKRAKELGLKGRKDIKLQIEKIGGDIEEIWSKEYVMRVVDQEGKEFELLLLGIKKISSDVSKVDERTIREIFPDARGIHRPKSGEIDCLIGYNYADFHPVKERANQHLVLLRNRFGYLIAGSHNSLKEHTEQVLMRGSVNKVRGVSVESFYEMEQLGINCSPRCGSCKCGNCQPGGKDMSLKEEREYNLIKDGLEYDKENMKWIANYPWIKDPAKLPNNKEAAFGALRSCEKRLLKNTELADTYNDQIDDMIKRGVCRKLEEDEVRMYDGPVFYIPHHEVRKPESKSTPMRIVFNSSANFRGHNMNEYLAKGPDMLNDLAGVLIRFRENYVAIAGDISKMFHSINTTVRDQMLHLFLWRNLDLGRTPDTYAIQVVNFGDRPSGAIALAALRQTADMSEEEFPEASLTVKRNSYMDDILDSVDRSDEAESLTEDVSKLLEKGSFRVKEWTTSSAMKRDDVRRSIPDIGRDIEETVLGMRWEVARDELKYDCKLNFSERIRKRKTAPDILPRDISESIPVLTKRKILSQVNGIYDPLGMLAPFIVTAKILMRKLWKEKGLDWDDAIPQSHQDEWKSFFEEFSKLPDVKIKRCMKPTNSTGNPMLVIFSDASEEAYGAAVYARWETTSDDYESRLIMSKTRIAPVRITDIVKLELSAAVVGKRLRKFVEKESRYQFSDILHIVDSEIVKAMVCKESYGFNTFAANRIGEIQESTDMEEWAWLAGKDNIADWCTRGKSLDEILEDSNWQKGPDFMRHPVSEWPISRNTNVEDYPMQRKVLIAVGNRDEDSLVRRIEIRRFSKLERLYGTTARIIWLYREYKQPRRKDATSAVSVETLEMAKRIWILDAQVSMRESLTGERYRKLVPRVRDGLVMAGGRCERWNEATWNKQEFILLPYDHRLSYLIAEHAHRKGGHKGITSTVAMIRREYWIVKVRKLVGGIINKCVPCRKRLKKLCEQVMGSLPEERLKPSPPFYHTSLDYFGPFAIRGEVQKRTRGKAYGVVFTCFTTRAVYIDVSNDYSTDGFLQVLRRFACIRGWPKTFYSDRGTQLVGASRELKEAIEDLDEAEITRFNANHGTEWSFSTPAAPWMNGVTEALVKTIKKAIESAIGDQVMEFSTLQTVMFEAGEMVNSRPIGLDPSSNIDDGKYLAANDLLLGRTTNAVPQGPFAGDRNINRRYYFTQEIATAFWKKWVELVFPGLVVRPKWHTERRRVSVGDVVIVKEEDALRATWKIARVVAVKDSKDGRVRTVLITYRNADAACNMTVERHVRKLVILLPIEEQ